MVAYDLAKVNVRVRFSLPAPVFYAGVSLVVKPRVVIPISRVQFSYACPILLRIFMTYVPLNRNVIVERKAPEKVSAGGIILQSSLEPDRAIVIATGDDSISIGEELLINWNKAYKIDSESYRIHIDDVIAVFED